METLALCCKTLYDNDMINKQNELDTYKKNNFQPVIYFDTLEEFEKRKQKLFTELENEIKNRWGNLDLDELYNETLRGPSLVSTFEHGLYHILIKVLQHLKFKHTGWLEKKIYSICSKLTITLNTMEEYLTNFEEDDKILKLIYHMVEVMLEEEFFKEEIYDAEDWTNDFMKRDSRRIRMWSNFKENSIFKIKE